MNWLDLDSSLIPFVVDSDANKQGKNIPGVNIPVESPNELKSCGKGLAVVLLALDHKEELVSFISSLCTDGVEIIDLLPSLS